MRVVSSLWRLLFMLFNNGRGENLAGNSLRLVDHITPYHLQVDGDSKTIEIKKRNWFLIGCDSKFYNFGQIRNIYIDEHLITADITIKVYAGVAKCYWLSKRNTSLLKGYMASIQRNGVDIGFIDADS